MRIYILAQGRQTSAGSKRECDLNSKISPEPTQKKWKMPSTVSSLLATDVSMTVL